MMSRRMTLVVFLVLVAGSVGFGAGSVFADKPTKQGALSLTVFEVDTVIDKDYAVSVEDDGVYAVLTEQGREVHRLSIEGGRGLVNNGTLSDGDLVRVAGDDKKHKYRGHVTILK